MKREKDEFLSADQSGLITLSSAGLQFRQKLGEIERKMRTFESYEEKKNQRYDGYKSSAPTAIAS